jgi:hypothetical protein
MASDKPKVIISFRIDFSDLTSVTKYIEKCKSEYNIPYDALLTVMSDQFGAIIQFQWREKAYTKAYLTKDFKAGQEVRNKYLDKYRNSERKGL